MTNSSLYIPWWDFHSFFHTCFFSLAQAFTEIVKILFNFFRWSSNRHATYPFQFSIFGFSSLQRILSFPSPKSVSSRFSILGPVGVFDKAHVRINGLKIKNAEFEYDIGPYPFLLPFQLFIFDPFLPLLRFVYLFRCYWMKLRYFGEIDNFEGIWK